MTGMTQSVRRRYSSKPGIISTILLFPGRLKIALFYEKGCAIFNCGYDIQVCPVWFFGDQYIHMEGFYPDFDGQARVGEIEKLGKIAEFPFLQTKCVLQSFVYFSHWQFANHAINRDICYGCQIICHHNRIGQ